MKAGRLNLIFYVINMSAAVCKWYEDKSHKLDYPNFKVWREGSF